MLPKPKVNTPLSLQPGCDHRYLHSALLVLTTSHPNMLFFIQRETETCVITKHCHNTPSKSTFKEGQTGPEGKLEKQWAAGTRKSRNHNKQQREHWSIPWIYFSPPNLSVSILHKLTFSLFPAGTKQQNKGRLIRIGKIGGGRLSSSSRQSNWTGPNDVHFV